MCSQLGFGGSGLCLAVTERWLFQCQLLDTSFQWPVAQVGDRGTDSPLWLWRGFSCTMCAVLCIVQPLLACLHLGFISVPGFFLSERQTAISSCSSGQHKDGTGQHCAWGRHPWQIQRLPVQSVTRRTAQSSRVQKLIRHKLLLATDHEID